MRHLQLVTNNSNKMEKEFRIAIKPCEDCDGALITALLPVDDAKIKKELDEKDIASDYFVLAEEHIAFNFLHKIVGREKIVRWRVKKMAKKTKQSLERNWDTSWVSKCKATE